VYLKYASYCAIEMNMKSYTIQHGLLVSCVFLALAASVSFGRGKELEFPLEVVCPYDVPKELRWDFVRGQAVECTVHPDPNVTAYPPLSSDKPLYGSVQLPSGFLSPPTDPGYYFVIDESKGTGTGYNRLFFDFDRDADFTDEAPILPNEDPPKDATMGMSWIKEHTCFDTLAIPCAYEDNLYRSIELMPRLDVTDNNDIYLCFVTTTARKGKIKIGRQSFDVWIGHKRYMSGWFDQPCTALHLLPNGDYSKRLDWGGWLISDMHRIGGTHWCLAPTPLGDTLRIRPYRGKYGTFSVSDGARRIGRARMNGVLWTKDTGVEVGGNLQYNHGPHAKMVSTCKIPVGDYVPGLEIYMGNFHITTCSNIHRDGIPQGRFRGLRSHSIRIRDKQPFVLDFSNKTDVFFALPGKDKHIRPGELLEVQAVLHDPVLDIIFTDLEWGQRRFEPPDSDEWVFGLLLDRIDLDDDWHQPLIFVLFLGPALICWLLSLVLKKKRRFLKVLFVMFIAFSMIVGLIYYRSGFRWDYDNLNPTVTILRSDGEVVSSGIMPFG